MKDQADADRIDVHDFRHALKLVTEKRETAHYRNKKGLRCPACRRPFERLFISEKRHNSFDPNAANPFCIRHESDRVLVFTH
ncbi:flagella cluster protein [Haloarculaceae archaeon H-GB2-1]|nr:flagella cluster protein [Haloarculaceae archaeon H-GB1-1]MEA5387527.1 flagella cluster protein [Haloarculaceae archaeon H-GB11]MEA5409009.1 flagella cluster protein [Haloarculaceae archaeon H-GB2-1]